MKAGKVAAVVVRSVKLFLRDKSTLFWSFAFPLMLLSFYVFLFAPGAGQGRAVSINVAVVPGSEAVAAYAEETAKYLKAPWNASLKLSVNATVWGNLSSAMNALKKGYLDAVVLVEPGSGRTLNVTVYVLRGTPDPSREELVAAYLYSFFYQAAHFEALGELSRFVNATASRVPGLAPAAAEVVERAWRAALNPGVRVVGVVPGEERAQLRSRVVGWLTLSVVFMSFMFEGVVGGAAAVASEAKRGFLRRLLSTKLTPSEYFAGLAISWLALMAASAVPTCLLGFVAYGGSLAVKILSAEALFLLLLVLVAGLLAFSAGLLIGLFFKSPESASVVANIIVWPTMAAGGFWLPKWMLPDPLRAFAEVNPFSILFSATSEVAVFGRSISGYLLPTVAAVLLSLALFAVAAVLYARLAPRLAEEAA